MDPVERDPVPAAGFALFGPADSRPPHREGCPSLGVDGLVLLSFLLLRVLRDRTLRRLDLSVFWSLVTSSILDENTLTIRMKTKAYAP
jgi:hypothetical protein